MHLYDKVFHTCLSLRDEMRGFWLSKLARIWQFRLMRKACGAWLTEPELEAIAHIYAEIHYQPRKKDYPLPLIFFIATEQQLMNRASIEQAWISLLNPTPRFFEIPGDHISTIEHPYVTETTRRAQAVLETFEDTPLPTNQVD